MDKISIDNTNEPIEITDEDVSETLEQQEVENVNTDQNDEETEQLASDETDEIVDETPDETPDETQQPVEYVRSRERVRNKKKKRSVKKIVTSLVLLLIIALITFFAYKGLKFLASLISSGDQIVTKSQEVSITSTGTLDYERFGDGVLVANSGVISYMNSELETVWEKQGFEGIPVVHHNGEYAIVTYTDTTKAVLINKDNAIPVDCPGKIVSSCVNKNGYFALVTTEDGFKNQIAVYDNSGNLFYKWHSSENYVTGVAVSPDNKSMCAATIGFTENGFDSGVLMFDFGQNSPVSGQHQSDNLIMKIEYVAKNKIVAIGDKCTSFYKTNGNKITDVAYGDKKLVTFDVTDTDKTVLCFSNDDSATSNSEVLSYNSRGKLYGKIDILGRIFSVSSCGDKILVSKDSNLELITDKCKRVRNASVVRDLKNSVLFNDGKCAFIISGNLAQVLKID